MRKKYIGELGTNIKNVILYCRVSSDEQAYGTSLDFQHESLENYCQKRGYHIVDVKREDYSAKHHDMRRPAMKSIYEYCKKHKGKIDSIFFLRWDRFTRSAEFAFRYIREFNEMGVYVNSIETPIDFNSPDWSTLIGVYCGNAQAENSKISKQRILKLVSAHAMAYARRSKQENVVIKPLAGIRIFV